jgi:hypothetical protein
MTEKKTQLLNIWGNTVDFSQVLWGVAGGAVLGYVSLIGGLRYLAKYHSGLQKDLAMGYALLFGVAGCVLAGLIAGRLFPPKHIYHEEEVSTDRLAVLKELKVDMRLEAEYLKHAPEKVIQEMKALQLYDLFSSGGETEAVKQVQQKGAGH